MYTHSLSQILCSLFQNSCYKNEGQSGVWYISIPNQLTVHYLKAEYLKSF